ncbi:hypothetical protein, partial [Christiangramia sp. SM2212]
MIWKTTLPKNYAPKKSPRRSFSILHFLFIPLFLLGSFVLNAQNVAVPVENPNGGFNIDGDLKANTPTPGIGDWFQGPSGTGGFVFDNNGNSVNPNTSKFVSDILNTSTDRFLKGNLNKASNSPGVWQWATSPSGPSAKSDIEHAFYHIARDANTGDQWIFVGADRISANGSTGTAYIDFSFFQGTIVENSDNTFTAPGNQGGRTVGDILLTLQYVNGGSNPLFYVYQWTETSPGNYEFVLLVTNDSTEDAYVPNPTNVFARVNIDGPIDSPTGAFGESTINQYKFVEGAINLTSLLDNLDVCKNEGIGINSIFVKSKSSAALTADLEDYITPISVDFTITSAEIAYLDSPVCSDSGNVQVTRVGPSGGKFTSTTGLVIDENTGEINVAASTAGTYVVSYSYTSYSCSKIATTEIEIVSVPDTPAISVDSQPSCDVSTGTISVDSPDSNVTYTISDGNGFTAESQDGEFTNLVAGSYFVIATKNYSSGTGTDTFTLDCTSTASNTVIITEQPTSPTAEITNNNGLALDCNTPSTTLTASGGSSYAWTNTNGDNLGDSASITVST